MQGGEQSWGVTFLQATGEMDAGPIWAAETFPMRRAKKSSLYRQEVSEAATRAVLLAVDRYAAGAFVPLPLADADPSVCGRQRPLMQQVDRAIDWQRDETAQILPD